MLLIVFWNYEKEIAIDETLIGVRKEVKSKKNEKREGGVSEFVGELIM